MQENSQPFFVGEIMKKITQGLFIFFAIAFCLVLYNYTELAKVQILSNRTKYESTYSIEAAHLRIRCHNIAAKIIALLKEKGWILACSESVTGGNLSASLSLAPGASAVFAGSGVCYKIEAKKQLLQVPDEKEEDLYDLQTAQDMAKGTQKLYTIQPQYKVQSNETYFEKPMFTIATTGRAVTWQDHWEGGVYVALTFPDGTTHSQYFKHIFFDKQGRQLEAQTKEEGMIVATFHALQYAYNALRQPK